MSKKSPSFEEVIQSLMDASVFIAAAETEDEIGCVLRMHLLIERLLTFYVETKIDGPIADYVAKPKTFAATLSLAVVFGYPLPLAAVMKKVNRIRNEFAHNANASLTEPDMKELERLVDNLTAIDSSFAPLKRRYIELPKTRPGEKIGYLSDSRRVDFLIATTAFWGLAATAVLSESAHLFTSNPGK
ncbi:hypothetical protein [Paraburkholderia dipogonis]|uniref:hypothetical protein n=1 Tax=Paraburkholderia dipogonis TaxID=1211383 RepID=UPI0038BCA08C